MIGMLMLINLLNLYFGDRCPSKLKGFLWHSPNYIQDNLSVTDFATISSYVSFSDQYKIAIQGSISI